MKTQTKTELIKYINWCIKTDARLLQRKGRKTLLLFARNNQSQQLHRQITQLCPEILCSSTQIEPRTSPVAAAVPCQFLVRKIHTPQASPICFHMSRNYNSTILHRGRCARSTHIL